MKLLESPINRIQEFIAVGGPVVVLLLGLSVLAVAVVLFKLYQFKSLKLGTDQAVGDISALAVRLKRYEIEHPSSRSDLEDTLAVSANTQIKSLQSGFRILDTIAQLAPLIGLFGTVLGMITAFQALQQSGNSVDPSILAGGIWVALLTTAVGLAVAMPTSIALTYFESQVERHQLAIELAVTRIINPVAHMAFDVPRTRNAKAGVWPVPADAA